MIQIISKLNYNSNHRKSRVSRNSEDEILYESYQQIIDRFKGLFIGLFAMI